MPEVGEHWSVWRVHPPNADCIRVGAAGVSKLVWAYKSCLFGRSFGIRLILRRYHKCLLTVQDMRVCMQKYGKFDDSGKKDLTVATYVV